MIGTVRQKTSGVLALVNIRRTPFLYLAYWAKCIKIKCAVKVTMKERYDDADEVYRLIESISYHCLRQDRNIEEIYDCFYQPFNFTVKVSENWN